MKNPSEIVVRVPPGAQTTALVYRAPSDGAGAALILGHGAGAGQLSPFIVSAARAIADLGIDVITFNFLYTEQRRHLPDRAPVLESCYRAVIEAVAADIESARGSLVIGGKSMGGRIATQVAAADSPESASGAKADRSLPIAGLVLLGYPLHPPGRPEQRRDAHLPAVARPMLFVQGSRDAFGTPAELAPILDSLTPRPTLHVVGGGDHSFKISRKDPAAQASVYDDVHCTVAMWVRAQAPARPGSA